jgi:IS30 family transposase
MDRRYAQLTLEERVEIYRLHADGKSRRAIAAFLARSPATISREVRRNSVKTKTWGGGYAPLRAQALTDRRRQRGRPHKLTASFAILASSRLPKRGESALRIRCALKKLTKRLTGTSA